MKENKLIYLAIPYTWNPNESFRIANEITAQLMNDGYVVFSPISHSHPVSDHLDPNLRTSQEFWMKQDLEIVPKCAKVFVVVIHGLITSGVDLIRESKGVQSELKCAEDNQIPVSFIDYTFVPQEKPNTNLINPTHGLRFNEGKPQWSLVSFDALEPMCRVLMYGAHKYSLFEDEAGNLIKGADIPIEEAKNYKLVSSGKDNWKKGMITNELMESLLRHAFAILRGERLDPESHIEHSGHLLCNAMFLSYMQKNMPEFDNLTIKEK